VRCLNIDNLIRVPKFEIYFWVQIYLFIITKYQHNRSYMDPEWNKGDKCFVPDCTKYKQTTKYKRMNN